MIGIYALWFEEPSLVYIGQSQDIDARYKEHIRKLKNNKATNYKVQEAYNKYGIPELVIVEECFITELNSKEIEWTAEFNSIKEGLNIIEAGQVGFGPNSNASKYTKRQILKVFSLLYRTNLSHIEIAKNSNVNKNLVHDIYKGKTHIWLKETYSNKYEKMKDREGFTTKGGPNITFITPEGKELELSNIGKYCKDLGFEHNSPLRRGLSKLRSGKLKSYLGWKIKEPDKHCK
jgi:predicted DNA-binding protein YlxM (UPF0122 family)/predicted GIY-YIG superfamily endonuclease